jgi:hypothetical protein
MNATSALERCKQISERTTLSPCFTPGKKLGACYRVQPQEVFPTDARHEGEQNTVTEIVNPDTRVEENLHRKRGL